MNRQGLALFRARWAEFQVAMMLLTRLPAGPVAEKPPSMSSGTWAWPVVGLVIGACSALGYGIATWAGLPGELAAVVGLATGVLATGGLHEDGLADVADGFGGGLTREKKLAIMRDSRIGSYGTIALVLSLGFRVTAIGAATDAALALICLAAASRACLPLALGLMPPARPDGLGRTASGSTPHPALLSAAIGFLCLLPLGLSSAIAIAIAMLLAAAVMGVLALRQIGGQTGDVLGAMQQVAEIAGWTAFIACAQA